MFITKQEAKIFVQKITLVNSKPTVYFNLSIFIIQKYLIGKILYSYIINIFTSLILNLKSLL